MMDKKKEDRKCGCDSRGNKADISSKRRNTASRNNKDKRVFDKKREYRKQANKTAGDVQGLIRKQQKQIDELLLTGNIEDEMKLYVLATNILGIRVEQLSKTLNLLMEKSGD